MSIFKVAAKNVAPIILTTLQGLPQSIIIL